MSATFEIERHQATASGEPAYGVLLIRMTGWAPFAASACRKARTLARYCAVVGVHGVGSEAPKSSFSTVSGVAQPARSTALAYSASAAA